MKKHTEGRKLALTILLGVFISIMVITLVNLIVSYAYEAPDYEDYCNESIYGGPYYEKPYTVPTYNCSYNKEVEEQANQCAISRGIPVYERDADGCAIALKECSHCQQDYDEARQAYDKNTFFIFPAVGFALIVLGLFVSPLLIQIISLPAGAILVIMAAVRNYGDDKLAVIITLSLLVIAAVYLALKKLKLIDL